MPDYVSNMEVADRINSYWTKRGYEAHAVGTYGGIKSRLTGWEHDRSGDKSFLQANQRLIAMQKTSVRRGGKSV